MKSMVLTILLLPIYLLCTAAFSARSAELMVGLFSGTSSILLRILILLVGIVYILLYLCGEYLFVEDLGILKNIPDKASAKAFFERKRTSGDIRIRRKAIGKLDWWNAKADWVLVLLERQAESDPDDGLRDSARRSAEHIVQKKAEVAAKAQMPATEAKGLTQKRAI